MSLVIGRPQGCALLSVSVSAALTLLGGCSFDATGLGETGSEVGGGESVTATTVETDGTSVASTSEASGGSESEGASGTTGSLTTGETSTSMTASTIEPSTSDATDPTDATDATEPTTTGVVPCDDPVTVYPDEDEDSYGDSQGALETCDPPAGYVDVAGDCDDGNDGVYPGADEVCDGVDNDCDLKVDEYSAANAGACNGCKALAEGERVYYFCLNPNDDDWGGAVDWCAKRGAQLVSINDGAEFSLIWSQIKSQGGDFWVGADDQEEEGVYVWEDGTALSKDNPGWAVNEPTGDGIFDLDCVALGGGWFSTTPGRLRTSLCDPAIDLGWICEAELDD